MDAYHRLRDWKGIVCWLDFLLASDLSYEILRCYGIHHPPIDVDVDVNMHNVDDNGYSIYTYIGQLGAVMYEIITARACVFDLFEHQPPGPARVGWPRREELPSIENFMAWSSHRKVLD